MPSNELPVTQPSMLQAPLARLLRPLVRLLIRSGMTFPALVELLRELYVNVAEHDFALPRKGQTDSRVSLLTGIHRKEVRRLRGAGTPVNNVPAALSRTSQILARWLADPRFTDDAGRPIPLPRTSDAQEPSFESLVAAVTRDVRPRAVLDEWIDRNLVVIDASHRAVLTAAAYVPQGADDDRFYYFGRNLHDHIAAAVANIEGHGPRFLERSVHYDGLSKEAAAHLQSKSREVAIETLQRLNKDAHATVEHTAPGAWRWNCGIYIFAEEVPLHGAHDGRELEQPDQPFQKASS